MTEHFYTVDLGKVYGRKLHRLAAFHAQDDLEDFAAALLSEALDRMEMQVNAEIYSLFEEEIEILQAIYKARNVAVSKKPKHTNNDSPYDDDGIPF